MKATDYLRNIFCWALVLLSACILPPSKKPAAVISETELDQVTLLQRGRDLAALGRFEAAEVELRKAAAIPGANYIVYNDLAFALMGRSKYAEAEFYLHHVLTERPHDFSSLLNLARLAYLQGRLEAARKILFKISELNRQQKLQVGGLKQDQALSQNELSLLLTNLSMVNFDLGYFDEALCFAEEAYQVSPTDYTLSRLVRLLLWAEKIDSAYRFLSTRLTAANQPRPTENLLLDLALVNYLRHDLAAGRAALNQLLSSPAEASTEVRTLAFLLQGVFLQDESRTAEIRDARTQLFQAEPKICLAEFGNRVSYWPDMALREAEVFLEPICGNSANPRAIVEQNPSAGFKIRDWIRSLGL
ncbi:tetratricopeptide repeat protein [bacterium]|nr:tetratricopeptide repeat protein [bacterium]